MDTLAVSKRRQAKAGASGAAQQDHAQKEEVGRTVGDTGEKAEPMVKGWQQPQAQMGIQSPMQ